MVLGGDFNPGPSGKLDRVGRVGHALGSTGIKSLHAELTERGERKVDSEDEWEQEGNANTSEDVVPPRPSAAT